MIKTADTLFITDTDDKSVTFTPALTQAVPGMQAAHERANLAFEDDPDARIQKMADAQFTFNSEHGGEIHVSVEAPEDGQLDEALIVFAPFADRNPATNASRMNEYRHGSKHGWVAKEFGAQPHTWSQATKSAYTHDLLSKLGRPMPVITIFSPIPTTVYSRNEREQLKSGDFTPAARIATDALAYVKDRIHGSSGTTTIDTLHFDGASLGASNAVGAAHGLLRSHNVQTVTARELIVDIDSLRQLAGRFMIKQTVGEPSTHPSHPDGQKVAESALRLDIDKYGIEPIGMISRSLGSMLKLTYMKGLTHPVPMLYSLRSIADTPTSLLVALGANSSISEFTPPYLPSDTGIELTTVIAEEGQKIGHIMNEFVALSASITAYHIAKSRR